MKTNWYEKQLFAQRLLVRGTLNPTGIAATLSFYWVWPIATETGSAVCRLDYVSNGEGTSFWVGPLTSVAVTSQRGWREIWREDREFELKGNDMKEELAVLWSTERYRPPILSTDPRLPFHLGMVHSMCHLAGEAVPQILQPKLIGLQKALNSTWGTFIPM